MSIKPGVKVGGVRSEMVLAALEARAVWESHGVRFVITSARDGKHQRGSKHYTGCAFDIRAAGAGRADVTAAMVVELRAALGPEFDVVHESIGTPNEHVHVEWDPKS